MKAQDAQRGTPLIKDTHNRGHAPHTAGLWPTMVPPQATRGLIPRVNRTFGLFCSVEKTLDAALRMMHPLILRM